MFLKNKDYKDWMAVKSKLQKKHQDGNFKISYKEGDVFWMSIGENVGYEEDGKNELYLRPVLVVYGISRTLFYGAPLTSQEKRGRFYYGVTLKGKKAFVMLNQISALDCARIEGRRMAIIPQKELRLIKERIKSAI